MKNYISSKDEYKKGFANMSSQMEPEKKKEKKLGKIKTSAR